MKKTTATSNLSQEILSAEMAQSEAYKALKEQFHATYESLKPINIITSTFNDLTTSPEIKNGISKVAIGMVSGYLAKNIVFRSSHNPIKKLAGMALQALVTNLVTKKSEKIQETGIGIFQAIRAFITQKKEPEVEA